MAKKKKKLMTKSEVESIPEREVPAKERAKNKKESTKKSSYTYILPFIVSVIIALAYLFTRIIWLLPALVVTGLITMFGWDGSSRTCPKCRKWNSVIWIKNERIKRTKTVTTKQKKEEKLFIMKVINRKRNKKNPEFVEKTKVVEERIKREHGKCKNCGHEFQNEKPILF